MSDPFDTIPEKQTEEGDPNEVRKKKLWRNLFLLNLGITLLLIGIFWLPMKFTQINSFFNSQSVKVPEKGKMTGSGVSKKETPAIKNMIPTHIAYINASSDKDWAYFDFSRGKQVKIIDPTSREWDLAFRRGKIISNGGATNKFGQVGLINMGEVDFDAVETVPTDNYVQDTATRTETESPILLKWYKYNYFTHKLTAKKNVYALRTTEKNYSKVLFISLYCEDKQMGCIKMQYAYQGNGSNSFLSGTNPVNWSADKKGPNTKKF